MLRQIGSRVQGLGREYALLFAERGAAVVVNDLGGSFKGEGQSTRAADKVVEEIKAKGGKAVANYDSVEFGEKLVETAIQNFGRLDIVVNNAGILRDKSFARISDLDWDLIHKVHLRGSFSVTRAAWPHMKKNNFGRIIMISSAAGIYGNFGQGNYSAAKLGLVGLSNTLSIEGKKYNIKCNAVAPTAGSRMTETVMPPELVAALKPEYVAPLIVYLCHEDTEETGGLFEVGAGWVSKLRWERTNGAVCRTASTKMTPESVRDEWQQITDFDNATYPQSAADTTRHLIGILSDLDGGLGGKKSTKSTSSSSNGINVELAKAAKIRPSTFTYGPKDAILYALGVGYTTKDEDYLKFLYEGSEDFSIVPSFSILASQASSAGIFTGGIPGLSVDVTKILHGEQYMELYKPFPPNGKLTSQARVVDVLDKGVGALILIDVDTYNEAKEKIAYNQSAIMVIGAGGFQGSKASPALKPMVKPPKRAPDASMAEKTGVDQAAIYRLTGDRNPLHIDPSFAAMGGFKQPILHGMCSFGYATRHVMKTYANNDVSKIKAIKTRFSKPVLPGETIQTDMWKDGNRVYFQCKVVETGVPCLTGAYVDLYDGATEAKVTSQPSGGSNMKSNAVFEAMKQQLAGKKDLVKKIKAVFGFEITKDGKTAAEWTADVKNGDGAIYQGKPKSGKADCTIVISDDDFVDLVSGKLNGQTAFMQGKMKLKGNMMLAQKLGDLFKDQAKL
ncbi:peroxisomal multifunctional enzyme type 2-like isoform X2 [Mercenaria mercenaria]|uniref:peroxisomal multifunctional enzyme type 2-like isoform X2 n=1 Tax=Mercenaria mercenaria TaxID=6596 RepID=UPI00234EB9AC|nr:peroxisomal multifunctional enzyme type 2-like isoform X2 [Mercenaria mercenaria]